MTRVALLRDAEGCVIGFVCEGHAGYAASGKDIVCAAVSMLSVTCANALQSVAEVQPDIDMKDGYLSVRLSPAQRTHDASVILRLFEQGICDIEESYPKHIHITTR